MYCISLVLIFADKSWLPCCAAPLPSLWTLHQSMARSALQMSSPCFHHMHVHHSSQARTRYTTHAVCIHEHNMHANSQTCRQENGRFNSERMTSSCQHDPAPPSPSSTLFSIFQLFCHFTPLLISHTLLTHPPLPPKGTASNQ